jgi:hypothetical protein
MKITMFSDEHDPKGFMVRVSREEAITIIQSLATQINNGSANSGREEFYTDDGEYFSISVICRDQSTKQCMAKLHLDRVVRDKE